MIDELRKYRNATPFVPFTIRFRDGREMHVKDTYHVAFGGRGLVVVYQESVDTFSRIDSNAIVEISADVSAAVS